MQTGFCSTLATFSCGFAGLNSANTLLLAKGFCRAKFWAKFEVSVLEGGSSGRSFSRSFSRSFRPCFAGTFRAKKTSAKTSALNSHDPAQQNWRNFREKLHNEVLQGAPRQPFCAIPWCSPTNIVGFFFL